FLFLLLFVSLFFAVQNARSIVNDNGTDKSKGKSTSKPEYVQDEILVKLKEDAHGRAVFSFNTNNNVQTKISSLDKLNDKHGVSKMDKIIKSKEKR
ncbi:hypothetical protein ACFL2A_05600, partial [Thermodesulfobacteriota bacterium]